MLSNLGLDWKLDVFISYIPNQMKYFLHYSPTPFQNTLFTFSILNLCLEWKLQGDHLRWDTYRLKQLQNFK